MSHLASRVWTTVTAAALAFALAAEARSGSTEGGGSQGSFILVTEGKSTPRMTFLSIENTGSKRIDRLWIHREGRPNYRSLDSLLRSIIPPNATEREKALRLWRFLRDNRYHWYPPENVSEATDPIKLCAVYGYGFCYDSAVVLAVLARRIGMPSTVVHLKAGTAHHVVSQVFYDNRWHLLDADKRVFFLLGDNTRIASLEDLARDPPLLRRTGIPGYGIGLSPEEPDAGTQALYLSPPANVQSIDDVRATEPVEMGFSLEPADRATLYWDWRLDFHGNYPMFEGPDGDRKDLPYRKPPVFSNGVLEADFADNPSGHIVFRSVLVPYVLVGVRVFLAADVAASDPSAGVGLLVSDPQRKRIFTARRMSSQPDGVTFIESEDPVIWERVGRLSESRPRWFDLRGLLHLDGADLQAKYGFFLKTRQDNATLKKLRIEAVFQLAPGALPDLALGENRLRVYADRAQPLQFERVRYDRQGETVEATVKSESLRIVFRYVESRNQQPTVEDMTCTPEPDAKVLKWRGDDPEGRITAYHVEVSPQPDFAYPLAPNFERITTDTVLRIPRSWLVHGRDYYWRVRARDDRGAWCPWAAERFTVQTRPGTQPATTP